MKTLTSTDLYTVLSERIGGNSSQFSDSDIKLWHEFMKTLYGLPDSGKSEYEILRTLNYAKDEYALLVEKARGCGNANTEYLARQALLAISNETDMHMLALRYPRISGGSGAPASPLHLNPECTQTDLTEIISGIHSIKLFCLEDGTPATLGDIISGFEWLCNVKFQNFDQKLHSAVNRKKGSAQCLERMIAALKLKGEK